MSGVRHQTCKVTRTRFEISEAEREYCERYDVPLPVISPRERLREIVIRRNRVHLFNSTCALSKRKIISMYPPEGGDVVLDSGVWFGDDWDGLTYGRPYDFTRPFFDQFQDLLRVVPKMALAVSYSTLENSDFTNGITGGKNLYLVFSSSFAADSLYCKSMWRSSFIVDSIYVRDCEICYGCEDISNCYNLKYSRHCSNCSDSVFLSSCIGCSNCYGCVNLERKQYHFFNQPLSRSEYERRMAEIDLGNRSVVESEQERFVAFEKQFPVRAYFGLRNLNSSGNYLNGNKNARNCYFTSNAEDVENCIYLDNARNCFSVVAYGNGSELIYNCCTVGDNAYNVRFCYDCWMNVRDLEYCAFCLNGCTDCFGCVGLKRQSYCVFNRQYSKQEYFDLVSRIKQHMRSTGEYGRFFPKEGSPFAHNTAETDDYFRLGKEEALALGYRWHDEAPTPTSDFQSVPNHIDDVTDEHLKGVYRCALTGRSYRLVRAELDFYRQHRIPLPNVAPLERIKSRLPFFAVNPLRSAKCGDCQVDFFTMVAPEVSAPVLCEDCFHRSLG